MIAAALFAIALLWAMWVIAGYPLWLRARAERHPKSFTKDSKLRTVSVIIAVRNGERYLESKLLSLMGQDYPRQLIEILVISDGSTDGGEQIVHKFAARGVRLVIQPPCGKAAALNRGIPLVTGEILILTDVRQVLDRDCIRELVACFGDPSVGVVSGDLRIRSTSDSEAESVGLYWRFESAVRRWLSKMDSMLGATGPIYAIRRELAEPLPSGIILDDMYLPMKAFFRGYRLIQEERAVAWDYPTALETEFRRKVRTLAGQYQLVRLMPELLSSRNRLRSDYVSYKLGRLLLPFSLIVMAICVWFLPDPWRTTLAIAQGAFYSLALLDLLWAQGAPGKRITSAARAFVVMMIAALCALSIVFVEPGKLWRVTQTSLATPAAGQQNFEPPVETNRTT